FGVLGASTLTASFLYFREENRLKAASNGGSNNDGSNNGGNGSNGGPSVSLTKPTDNTPNQ
ncbi:MAG: hypothetical protein K2Z81_05810, partial [Cyanobacteria bacterium]|nr:hypothetical protein [Cyanobacteriota bacterium]